MSSEGERPAAESRSQRRWGLGDAVGGFLAGLLLSGFIGGLWLGGTGEKELDLTGQAVSQLGLWAGLVGAAVWASRRKGAGTLTVDFGFRGRPVDLGVGAAVGVLAQVVLVPGVALLMSPIVGRPDISGPVEDLFKDAHGIGLIGLVLFTVIGAPVVEELFFRGLLLRSFQRRAGAVVSILLTGVLFGVAHPQPLPGDALAVVMVTLAALGAVLGVLAVRTDRLGAAIVAHAVFNGWTAAFLVFR